jgi:hypothetical protein
LSGLVKYVEAAEKLEEEQKETVYNTIVIQLSYLVYTPDLQLEILAGAINQLQYLMRINEVKTIIEELCLRYFDKLKYVELSRTIPALVVEEITEDQLKNSIRIMMKAVLSEKYQEELKHYVEFFEVKAMEVKPIDDEEIKHERMENEMGGEIDLNPAKSVLDSLPIAKEESQLKLWGKQAK